VSPLQLHAVLPPRAVQGASQDEAAPTQPTLPRQPETARGLLAAAPPPGLPLVRRLAAAVTSAKSAAVDGAAATAVPGGLPLWQLGKTGPLYPLSLGPADAAVVLVPDIASSVDAQAAAPARGYDRMVHQAIARQAGAFVRLTDGQKARARDLIYNALLCLDLPAASPWHLSERQFVWLLEATPAFVRNEAAPTTAPIVTTGALVTRPMKVPLRVTVPDRSMPSDAHRLLAPYIHASGDHTVIDLSGLDLRVGEGELLGALSQTQWPPSTLIDLSGANLQGMTVPRLRLAHAVLDGANLRSANLVRADLEGASLRGADLSHANLSYANFSSADLSGARADSANLGHASLSGATLKGCSLRRVTLFNAELSRAQLIDADLAGARLHAVRATDANFERSNLDGADLSYARLAHARFDRASLVDVSFNEALLVGTDFRQSWQHQVHWGLADTAQALGVQADAATQAPFDGAPAQLIAKAAAEGLLAKNEVKLAPEYHADLQSLLLVAIGRQAQLWRDGGLLSLPPQRAAELRANTSSVAAHALHLMRLDWPSSQRVVQTAIDSLDLMRAWSRQAPGGQVPTRLQAEELATEQDPIKRACMAYLALSRTIGTLDNQWDLLLRQPTNGQTPIYDTLAGLKLLEQLAATDTPLAKLFTSQWGLELPMGAQDVAQRQRLDLQAGIIRTVATINQRLHTAAMQRQRMDPSQLKEDLAALQTLSARVEAAQLNPQTANAAPAGGWSAAQHILRTVSDSVEQYLP
jgi:uncharacterized protein YjbI with pentapeptide repeats